MNITLFAYIGPETTFPLMSIIASALGVILMFGRRARSLAKSCVSAIFGKAPASPKRWRSTKAKIQEQ